MRLALARSAEAVLGYYLDAVHALGAELSISTEHVAVSDAVLKLAEASHDTGRSREDEPYRRALSGIYARLSATHEQLTGKPPPAPRRFGRALCRSAAHSARNSSRSPAGSRPKAPARWRAAARWAG
jgi:phosphoenolpyruvate carboxylase